MKRSYRILLVDDCDESGFLVKVSLKPYEIHQVHTVAQAESALAGAPFDLILIDVILPDGDGFRMCNSLNSEPRFKSIPKIMLTAKTDTSDKVFGLNCGADDYVTKPFDSTELKARVDVRLRNLPSAEPTQFTVGCFDFEPEFHRCSVLTGDMKTDLHLTPTEFRIFLTLVRSEGIPQSRQALMKVVWAASGTNIEARGIDTHVAHLRKKLGALSSTVQSVYGKGYVFKLPEAA